MDAVLEELKSRVRLIKGERIKYMYEYVVSICSIREIMKSKGNFMEWYMSEGFNKDEISLIIKRKKIYDLCPGHEDYVSSLSDRDVKYMTKSNFSSSDVTDMVKSRTRLKYEGIKQKPTTKTDIEKLVEIVGNIKKSELTESDRVELMRVKIAIQILIGTCDFFR